MAQQIRDLGIADRAVAVMNTLRTSMILPPPGQRLGPARDVPCYPAATTTTRYTLTYPGAEPIDVHSSRQHV